MVQLLRFMLLFMERKIVCIVDHGSLLMKNLPKYAKAAFPTHINRYMLHAMFMFLLQNLRL